MITSAKRAKIGQAMNWNDDQELARRVAEVAPLTFEEALNALKGGGRPRELVLGFLKTNEENRQVLDQIAETRRNLRELAVA